MRSWKNYTGKEVVVTASGVEYSGVLVEMTETSILLRGTGGFCEIRMEGVTSMELKGAAKRGLKSPSPLAGL